VSLSRRAWVATPRRDELAAGARVRLAATVLVLGALPFGTWMSGWERLAIAAVFVVNHLVATLAERAALRDARVPHHAISAVAGAAAIFAASLLNPRGEIIMLLAFIVLVAYFASSAGRSVAIVASVVAVALTVIVAAVHDDGPDIDVLTFVVFAFALVATALLIDRLTIDRLRIAGAAERQQGEFLAAVSHELRTPLTAVQGFAEALVEQWDDLSDEQRRALLRRVETNARELDALIAQLLDYTRLESVGELQVQSIGLKAWLEPVIDSLPPRAAPERVELRVPDHLEVQADPEALRHIVVNLVTNAAKFAPSGPIVVEAELDGDDVVISVTDQGPGVDVADRARIFERFEQGSRGEGPNRGFGLGLSIVSEYVERIGGRVWVESDVGEGATFLVSLRGSELDRPV
jgi:signal transduction histidine kinase